MPPAATSTSPEAKASNPTEHGIIRRYDSSCHPVVSLELPQIGCAPVESFGAGFFPPNRAGGLAIDSATKTIYVDEGDRIAVFAIEAVPDVKTTKPTDPTATSATLTGTVDPGGIELNEGLKGCRFEYVEAALYEPAAANPYAAGHTAECDKSAAEIGNVTEAVEVTAPIAGLQAGVDLPLPPARLQPQRLQRIDRPPRIRRRPLLRPAADRSRLHPRRQLQRRRSAGRGKPQRPPDPPADRVRDPGTLRRTDGFSEPLSTEEQDIGSAGTTQAVPVELAGLAPATAYRYRAVAENVLGEGPEAAIGPEGAFTTQAAGPFSLPDSRQWQLVSPPDKLGARISPIDESGVVQAAAGGHAVTYLANLPVTPEPQGYTNEAQILSTRGTGGWSTRDIGIPHIEATGFAVGPGPEYKFFSSDLSTSAVQPYGQFDPGLSAEASEATAYLHDLGGSCGRSCYRPLVTAKEGFANVPEGTVFGEGGDCFACGPQFLGASEDLSHVVLSANAALTPGAAPKGGLYEWAGGALSPVSVPAGRRSDRQASLGLGSQATRGAISADGSRDRLGKRQRNPLPAPRRHRPPERLRRLR